MDFLKMKKQETYFAFRYEKMPKNFMDQSDHFVIC